MAKHLEDAGTKELSGEETMVKVSSVMELSLNSVVGLTSPKTFKVKGMVEDREIIIIFDCGATHNFIALKLMDELKITMAVQGRGMCKSVTIGLPVITIMEDFLPLELRNLDIVLGM